MLDGISHGSSGNRLHRLLGQRLTWVPQTLWLGLRGLFRRRGRAVLTLVMLILAGITFLSVATTNYAIDTKIASFFANYDHDLQLTVQSDPLPWSPLRTEVLAVPNVQRVERLGDDTITTTWGGMRLTGVDGDTQLYHRRVVAGRWFAPNERNVVLLSDDAVSATGLKVGSILAFSHLGRPITWTIIGIVHDSRADVGAIGVALTTSENFNLVSGNPVDSASMLMIQARDRSPTAIGQLQARLQTTLKQAGLHITVDSAQQKMQEEIQVTQQQFLPLYVMLYAVAVIVALVGILGLSNTLITSVLERRREIGIWRSMGASGWRAARIFWVEALALAGMAWVGSLLVGVPAAMGFLQLVDHWARFNVPFAFDSMALGIMLMVLLVVATLASFGPAGSAARLRIADILRYE